MNQTEWHRAEDVAYRERIRSYTLSELEDVYANLDRREYPQRFDMVHEELEIRLEMLGSAPSGRGDAEGTPAGFFRRLWACLIDLFVHALILGALYLVVQGVLGLIESFRPEDVTVSAPPSGGSQASPFLTFLGGLFQGDAEAWKNTAQWGNLGLGVLGVLLYKAVLTIPVWVRSGSTTGMREAGVRLEMADGRPVGVNRALLRYWVQYMLFVLSLGVSSLWMLWDRNRQALHDKLAGTRVVRVLRTWEQPEDVRMYED